MPVFKHHVFVCHNVRPEGAPRPSCTADGKSDVAAELQQRVKAANEAGQLSGPIRINKAGCLDRCEEGPVLVVYPQGTWYTFVDNQDIDEIIDVHLIGGKIVERLKI